MIKSWASKYPCEPSGATGRPVKVDALFAGHPIVPEEDGTRSTGVLSAGTAPFIGRLIDALPQDGRSH